MVPQTRLSKAELELEKEYLRLDGMKIINQRIKYIFGGSIGLLVVVLGIVIAIASPISLDNFLKGFFRDSWLFAVLLHSIILNIILIVVLFFVFRNKKRLNAKLNECRKKQESKDEYNASSGLNKFGDHPEFDGV